ncbi:nuclease (SNase domain-containing protein) [Thermodesulfatator indicus DSM 15286]|uniref:Nuclease (SNase domain-containing protein) n=1 Tax=Thermodesulfatator indicus (strain DSM 15286 / JCM 11887 / CIR29812) TaxID=667014 RepID=F8AD70_THEID|nr:thermonuclease family protein [Thermodesulfatator indicus]AEH44802.1 nuclease (SNase domain-containing protein) [Thermodesulfatator indicus DSM 15286]
MKKIGIFLCFLIFWLPLGCNAHKETHYVRWVIDGDTIVLENGQKVRYAGINAPEIAHEDKPGEPFGRKALKYNIKLVKGKKIILELAEEKRDRFGRILAYVFLPDGTFVQEALVKKGLAFICYMPPNTKYFERLLEVQRQAMRQKIGIWGVDSLFEGEPYYIGNKRSRRFHRPSCRLGLKTSPRNKVIFRSMKEAFFEGFCPCRKCRPWPGKR